VKIWVERQGADVADLKLSNGEPSLTCHIEIDVARKSDVTTYVKSIAIGNPGYNSLVWFTHPNRLEWICSIETNKDQLIGSDNHTIDVDTNSGTSSLKAVEILLSDSLGVDKEILYLDLPLTVT
jgi:hypothetical protein